MTLESVFQLDDAKALAAMAYRTSRPGPWEGKEVKLLDALRTAELHHEAYLPHEKEVAANQPECPKLKRQKVERLKQLSRALRKSIGLYNELESDQRLSIAVPFFDREGYETCIESQIHKFVRDSNQSEWGAADDFIEKTIAIANSLRVQQLEYLFTTMEKIADCIDVGDGVEKRGQKGLLGALKNFIVSLEISWEEEGIKEAFSPEFLDGGEPVSAAAILVVEAAHRLGQSYTGTQCQNAWRPRSGRRRVA